MLQIPHLMSNQQKRYQELHEEMSQQKLETTLLRFERQHIFM